MRPSGIITLLTDFGEQDYFVGAMKGEILSRAPDVRLVDLSHQVRAHDILHGAFILRHAYRHFPAGTVHLFVIDPGVGSARRPVAVLAHGHYFVGPDNGLLSLVLEDSPFEAVVLERREYFRSEISRTFHGRDLFAPVAAHLARGVELREFGTPISELVPACWPRPQRLAKGLKGQILHIDRFGNAITNLRPEDIPPVEQVRFRCGRLRCEGLASAYAAVEPGQPLAIVGSAGFIELSVREASAAALYGLHPGDPVILRWKP
jgi:S-adenosylmethionine hydrolase|nr:MAG: hypothetical protein KatS3mg041_0136 [Bacteroidota bacterium]